MGVMPDAKGYKAEAAAEAGEHELPFPARSPAPWCDLNRVTGICGTDSLHASGVTEDAPLKLSKEICDGAGNLASVPPKVDLLIVGAGLSGAVLAERCSKELGMTSLIIDNRDHIGGNCYDYVEEHGIRVSRYGAHLFHTKYERVWDYVTKFSEWMPYDHRVRGLVPDRNGEKQLVPIPPVQATVNALFGENISSEEEMQAWYDKQRVPCPGEQPANSEEALSQEWVPSSMNASSSTTRRSNGTSTHRSSMHR